MKKILLCGLLFFVPMVAFAKVPYWQSVYGAFDIGDETYGEEDQNSDYTALPTGWGWPTKHTTNQTWDFSTGISGYRQINSYFDAFPTNDQSQHVLVRDIMFKGNQPDYMHYLDSTGSILIAANQEITLEWACQDYQWRTGISEHYPYYYQIQIWPYQTGPVSYGFKIPFPTTEYNFRYVDSVTVKPALTTTYSLVCEHYANNNVYYYVYTQDAYHAYSKFVTKGDPAVTSTKKMSITVHVCTGGSASEESPGIYKLPPSSKSIGIEGVGCLLNLTNNTYLVPTGSADEIDAFATQVTNAALKDANGVVSFQ